MLALLVIVVLPLSSILKVSEAIAGFSDPNVILIAAMFVIGEGSCARESLFASVTG
jgi:di/tricarboxylate transporter